MLRAAALFILILIMATRGRPPTVKFSNIEEVAQRLAELELENKTLRRKLGKGAGSATGSAKEPAAEPTLTSAQKEALLAGLISRLSSLATSKIDAKVRTMFKKIETKSAFEEQTTKINMRVDLSWGELVTRSGGRSPSVRRPRAASRSRATTD